MKKIRAIYIGDVRFDQCPVFELNTDTNYFEMLIDKEFRYEKEVVEEDDEFLVFVVENDIATVIKEQLPNVALGAFKGDKQSFVEYLFKGSKGVNSMNKRGTGVAFIAIAAFLFSAK